MVNNVIYCFAAFLFVVFVVLFVISNSTSRQRYCQTGSNVSNTNVSNTNVSNTLSTSCSTEPCEPEYKCKKWIKRCIKMKLPKCYCNKQVGPLFKYKKCYDKCSTKLKNCRKSNKKCISDAWKCLQKCPFRCVYPSLKGI